MEYYFVCSSCSEKIVVDEEMKSCLTENGCPVCEADVMPEDFVEKRNRRTSA